MAIDLMSRVRTRLLLEHPFFGAPAMQLKMVEDPSIETAQTDGVVLRCNPQFLASLNESEQVGLFAHEVWHCMALHVFRRGGRDMDGWNEAADYSTNEILTKAGVVLPKGALLDASYRGMSAEEIYSKRQQKPKEGEDGKKGQPQAGSGASKPGGEGKGTGDLKEQAQGPGNGQAGKVPGSGAPVPTGSFTDAPIEEAGEGLEQDWQIIAEQAARVAALAGSCPGGAHGVLQRTHAPQVDWKSELREFIVHSVPSDQSWSRPNRRFIGNGIYLPGTVKENTGVLAVIMDSSGSTWSMLGIFARELAGIIEETRPEKVIFVQGDAKYQAHEEYTPDNVPDEIKLKGGGGTRTQWAFDWLKEQEEEPTAVIYLTDLEIFDKPLEPEYPVLWAVPEWVQKAAPFGQLVKIVEEK